MATMQRKSDSTLLMRFQHIVIGVIVVMLGILAVLPLAGTVWPDARGYLWPLMLLVLMTASAIACEAVYRRGQYRQLMIGGMAAPFLLLTTYLGVVIAASLDMIGVGLTLVSFEAVVMIAAWITLISAAVSLIAAQWAVFLLVPLHNDAARNMAAVVKAATIAYATLIVVSFLPMMPHEFAVAIVPVFPILLIIAAVIAAYLWAIRTVKRGRAVVHAGAVIIAAAIGVTLQTSGLAASLLALLVVEGRDAAGRMSGYLAAGFGAIIASTAIVVVFGWRDLLRRRRRLDAFNRGLKITLTCPRCGEQATKFSGIDRCAACNLILRLRAEEPYCACGYALSHIGSDRCPECGRPVLETTRHGLLVE